jgi:hypothetical protein
VRELSSANTVCACMKYSILIQLILSISIFTEERIILTLESTFRDQKLLEMLLPKKVHSFPKAIKRLFMNMARVNGKSTPLCP